MRELVNSGRQSGRTTTLLMTMIEEMEMHDQQVYLVVGTYCLGHVLKQTIRALNGNSSRVRAVALESLYILRGLDPRNIYIEHTAYEKATSDQLQTLYFYEDAKDNMIWRDK